MKRYEANWRYYFFLGLFPAVILLGAFAVYALLSGKVSTEDGALSRTFALIISIPICLVLSTYAITSYRLLRQIVKFNNCLLTITPNGVENTLVFIYLFAFVLVLPVKIIPWEAITYFDADNMYIRVNTKMVKAGPIAKLLLFILGYHFCFSFTKLSASAKDIQPFMPHTDIAKTLIL